MGKIFAMLLSVLVLTSCGQDFKLPELKQSNFRTQMKDNLKSALESLAQESNASGGALMKTVAHFQRMTGLGDVKAEYADLDPSLLSQFVSVMLDSDFVKELFSDFNVVSHNDIEVVYVIDRAVCEKMGEMIDNCYALLEKSTFELHLKTPGNQLIELELWQGEVSQAAKAKQFVVSLSTAPNSLRQRVKLDGLKDFASSLAQMNTLTGAIAWELRFKTPQSESGCKNNESLCFTANCTEDINVESEDGEIALKIEKTPSDKTAISIAAFDKSVVGDFNLAAIEGGLYGNQFVIEASQFTLTLPEQKDPNAFHLSVQNLSQGARPTMIAGYDKKFVFDFGQNERSIEQIKLAISPTQTTVQTTPFAVSLSFQDQSDESSKTYEALKAASKSGTMFVLKNELALGVFKDLSVGAANCDTSLIAVKAGDLNVDYAYHINNDADKTMTYELTTDQCLLQNQG